MDEARQHSVEALKGRIDDIVQLDFAALSRRPELGTINFSKGESTFGYIQELFTTLASLPPDRLPMDILNSMNSAIQSLLNVLHSIKTFSIEQPNAVQLRDNLLEGLKREYDTVFKTVAVWLPYMKMQSGDALEGRRRLDEIVRDAVSKLDEIREYKDRAESTAKAAQDAAAKVGVAHHATRFADVAKNYGEESRRWLVTAFVFGVLTIVAGVLLPIVFPLSAGTIDLTSIQRVVTKLIVVSVLLTAAIWAAKNYRALRHLQVANDHRQHALGTFETFVEGSDDEETRNAVLLEATRAIFQHSASGFVPSDDSGLPATKILEVVRTLKPPTG